MEQHAQSIGGALIRGLSYKLKAGASYVTGRRSVTSTLVLLMYWSPVVATNLQVHILKVGVLVHILIVASGGNQYSSSHTHCMYWCTYSKLVHILIVCIGAHTQSWCTFFHCIGRQWWQPIFKFTYSLYVLVHMLKVGASYVLVASGGNQYSSSGVKVMRFNLASDHWMDPSTFRIMFQLNNKSFVANGTNFVLPLSWNPAVFQTMKDYRRWSGN